ncbi:nucleoside hydrolase [Tissierella pigra]|uniref:Nucleoside hydrolase n=1 Tax=Tissierella pigra TaxID=2607614 RepID=A0A6N7XW04_9FIRM|nr:nucleoside hydrolase [Tissierella pigra]MBU5428299.1 nucleoside hydrolase [Tissierella pigra]MSU01623.1 nucleoside hydrolase [Tissierella pigra]
MGRKIIIDCDNTFGIDGCDVDDGLAIIYALAQREVEVLGISTTFGNNSLDIVYPNTISFMKNIGYPEIPVYKGSEDSYENNKAAKFLVEMVNKYNGDLCILATGSLTNLYDAWKIDNKFYEKIKSISLMGGITAPLVINNKILNELNFSCNAEASLNVLEHGKNITIATGNTCLDGFFTRERFETLKEGNDFEKWLYVQCEYWFDREKNVFKNEGIYIWDILSAAALLNPNLFIKNTINISPDEESMKKGLLIGKGKTREVIIPKIKDVDEYIEHVYNQYRIFGEKF